MSITIHPPGEFPPTAPSGPASGPSPAGAPMPQPAQQAAPAPAQGPARPRYETRYVVDERGRRIGWRRLNALEDFDLTEIAGAAAANQEWMIRATIAFGVREIDGEVVSRPQTKDMLRAMVARLEDEGFAAVLSIFRDQAEQEAVRPEQDTAKN